MAHVNYTGNASQLFGVIDQIKAKFAELGKLNTNMVITAQLRKDAKQLLQTETRRITNSVSGSGVYVAIQLRVTNQTETFKRLKTAFATAIMAKVQPYVTNAAIKTVKDRIKNAVGASTAEIGLRFQQGAAGKFRDTLKRLLAVLSRGSYVDAEIRLKNAQKQLSALQSKKLLLDVEVATGTAAKVKALLALLKSLRDGAKIPIRLDMDAGTRLVLQQLATELKRAADSAARLNGRLGGAASGAGSLARGGRDVVSWWSRATSVFAGFASSQLVLSAIHRTFAALKDALVDFPAQIQAVQVGFERMLGSKERAEGLMHELKEFAVPTPFETQDLAPLATQALAFKLVDKKDLDAPKQIVSLIKDIGDAAYGLGKGQQGVNQLMAAFGQIKVGTKVSGREMLRFQRVGVNAFEYLSQATGKSTKEVRELISKGLLPADKAIAAIRAGLRRDFAGGMEKAAQTMLGASSQIKDALRIRLADTFAPQFEQATKFVVKLADTISSEDFGKKLDVVAGVAQSAIERIGEAWRILTDLYTHNSGIINAALLSVGATLLLLNAYARGGPIGAFLTLASAMSALSQRTDTVGKAAKVLQPILYGVAAAYTAVKIAAIGATVAQGLTTGITAATRLVSIFKFIAGSSGPAAAFDAILTDMTASVLPLALYALPVLVAAIGVAAIGFEAYKEKASRVDAANAALAVSSAQVADAFKTTSQVAAINPDVAEQVTKLKKRYDELKGSVEGLKEFKSRDLPLEMARVALDPKIKNEDKEALLASLRELGREVDHELQDKQFKVQVEAEANPLSLANLVEAFRRTYSQLYDFWYSTYIGPFVDSTKWAWGQAYYVAKTSFDGIAQGMKDLRKGLGDAWYSMTGGFDSAFNKMLRSMTDKVTGLIGTVVGALAKAWNTFRSWYMGQSDDGSKLPELPGNYTPEMLAEQKRKHLEWLKSHPEAQGKGAQLPASADPYGDPANGPQKFGPPVLQPGIARDRAIIAAWKANNAPAPGGESIPTFAPDAPGPKKTRGKSDAEKAADAQRRQQLKEEKDQLSDSAKSWDERAKAIEDSAKRQVEALTQTRDAFRDVFGSMQEEFVRLGIINDPLGPMIRSFERLIDLGGKSAKVVGDARRKYNDAIGKANMARSQQERLNGLDGVVPSDSKSGKLVGGGGGGSMPSFLRAMAANVGGTIGEQCGATITTFLNRAGIKTTATALARSGNARANADGTYAPGSVFNFKGGRPGYRVNHYAMVAPDGEHWLESNWAGKGQRPNMITSSRRINWARDIAAATWGGRRNIGQASGVVPGAGVYRGTVPSVSGGTGKAFTAKAFDASAIDGVLSKVSAVPAAWGKAVKSTETTTARFALQTRLATKEFQEQIEQAAKQSGKSVPEIIAWLRRLGNEADARINHAKSVDAVTESLRDLAKQKRDLARDGNPLAGVMGEFEAGGKFEFAPDKRVAVYDAQMSLAMAQTAKATKEVTRAESMRIGVLKAAAPYLNAQTAGTNAYELALERANTRFEAWNDAQVRGNLLAAETFDKRGGAALRMAENFERVAKILKAQGMPTSGLLEDAGRLRKEGNGLKGRAAGIRTSTSQNVQKQITAKNSSAEYGRAVGRTQENLDTNFELDNRIKLLRDESQVLGDSSKSEQEKADATERANAILEEQIKLMKAGHTATRALELAQQRAAKRDIATGLQRQNDAMREYNKSQKEVTDAQAAFGDMTGLAALKIELSTDKYKTLTDAQKAQMLVNAAAIQGLQRYGQEFDSLFSQRFALAEENLTRQIGLTRGLSAVEQQELKWKFADMEARERLAGMTQKQRDAYDAQLPKILAARDAVRSLLAAQQKLAEADWFKNQRRSFQVLAEPNELKRARAELEQELTDQGFKDPIVIEAILNTNDMLLRLQRSQDHIKDYVQGVSEVFGHAFDEAYEKGPGHFISATLDGFADMIQGVARQLITAQLTKLFVKAFPSLAGEYDQASTKAEDMNAATLKTAGVSSIAAAAVAELTRRIKEYSEAAGNVPSIAGGISGGGGLFGGLLNLATGFFGGGGKRSAPTGATGPISSGLASGGRGLFRDFSTSNLSQNVFAQRDTEMFNAISSNTGGGGRQVASVGGGDTNLNIANLNLPRVREGRDFVPELQKQVGPRLSRRSKQNIAWDGVSPGKRQR